MNKYDKEDIYKFFRRAQSSTLGRGYRMPKDFDVWLEKLSSKNRENLHKIMVWFNTKWHEIDPQRYFLCGFELYKSFSYVHFFDERILRLYIHKDKHIKRDIKLSKKNLVESVKFVNRYKEHYKIPSFGVYCRSMADNRSLPVKHYLENKIDGFFLTWLVYSKAVDLTEDEKALIPYVLKHYRKNVAKLLDMNDFLKKIKEKI
jgi:hypothetical protein